MYRLKGQIRHLFLFYFPLAICYPVLDNTNTSIMREKQGKGKLSLSLYIFPVNFEISKKSAALFLFVTKYLLKLGGVSIQSLQKFLLTCLGSLIHTSLYYAVLTSSSTIATIFHIFHIFSCLIGLTCFCIELFINNIYSSGHDKP